jgi:hypothetical protein
MAYLTESKLKSTVDLPIALPDTSLKQSDYVVIATVKLLAAQRLSLRVLTLQLLSATIDPTVVDATNKVIPNLGVAYVVLRKDYTSGVPGDTGALDYIFVENIGVASRTTVPYVMSTPGNYSIIVANNMQASSTSPIPPSTSIDFKVIVTGQFRLELSIA